MATSTNITSIKLLDEARQLCTRDAFERVVPAESSIKFVVGVVGPRRQGKSTLCNRMFFGNSDSPFRAERGFRGVTRGIDAALSEEGVLVLDSEGLFDVNQNDDCVLNVLLFLCDLVVYNCTSNLDDSHVDSITRALRLYESLCEQTPHLKDSPKHIMLFLQGCAQGAFSDEEFAAEFPLRSPLENVKFLYRCTDSRSTEHLPSDLVHRALQTPVPERTADDFYSLMDLLRPVISSFDNKGQVPWDAIFALQYPCTQHCHVCGAKCKGSTVVSHTEHTYDHKEIVCDRKCQQCLAHCQVRVCHDSRAAGNCECIFLHKKDRCMDIPIPWYIMKRCPFCRFWTGGDPCECPEGKLAVLQTKLFK